MNRGGAPGGLREGGGAPGGLEVREGGGAPGVMGGGGGGNRRDIVQDKVQTEGRRFRRLHTCFC